MIDCMPYLEAHRDELLEHLASLIRIPSVEGAPAPGAPFGREVARCLEKMLTLCERLGLRTGSMDGRVGWCEYGAGEEMIAVLAHLDVVPAGEGWTEAAPFAGEVKNGRIYGRGAMDDKGPAVAAVYALAALRDAGFVPARRIRILFGTRPAVRIWRGTARTAAKCRSWALRRTANTRSSTAKRAFSPAPMRAALPHPAHTG